MLCQKRMCQAEKNSWDEQALSINTTQTVKNEVDFYIVKVYFYFLTSSMCVPSADVLR